MTWLTTKRAAAILAILGAAATTVGVVMVFGLPGGLICGGLFLVVAASSNL